MDSVAAPANAHAPEPPPRKSHPLETGDGEAPSSNDDNARPRAMSGLELDEVEPASMLDGVAPLAAVESETEKDLAGFNSPRDGFIAAFQYWLHVHKRLKILDAQRREAKAKADADQQESLRLQADLGRKLHASADPPKALIPLMDAARLAEGERSGTERRRISRSLEHKTEIDGLQSTIGTIEQQIAPALAQRRKVEQERRKLLEEERGIETQKRRVQIDLRNMEKLIRERKERLKSKTEDAPREKLALEISRFENRCPTLHHQLHGFDEAIEKVSIPLKACDMELNILADQIAPENAKIAALKSEISELENQFKQEDEATRTILQAETQKATGAWAEVANTALSKRFDLPEGLLETAHSVRQTMISARDSSHHVRLLERAIDSYDKPTIQKAKKQAIIIIAVFVLIIALFALFL